MTAAAHAADDAPDAMPTCVVIDDHEILVQALTHALEAANIAVVGTAATAEEGVRLVRDLRPTVALIDLALRGELSGLAATELLGEEQLPTRIVIVTGSDRPAHVARAFDHGAWGYVTKMNSVENIVESVRSVIAGSRYVDPAVAAELARPSGRSPSERELEVLALMARGMNNDEIANAIGVSRETVKTHISHLLGKLGVQTRTEAVAHAIRNGLLD